MIRYALSCDQDHEFDSWFPSSDSFEAQAARGLVSCPACGSANVGKQIMAPSVARASDRTAGPAPAPEQQPMALLSEKEQALRSMLKALREHVLAHAENVGERFADEARKMHHGEIEHRSIYGQASLADAKALLEEGIAVHPLPVVPDDRN